MTPPKLAALAERGRVVTRERSEKNEKERIKENRRKGEKEKNGKWWHLTTGGTLDRALTWDIALVVIISGW